MGTYIRVWQVGVGPWQAMCAEISARIAARLPEVGDLLAAGEFNPRGDEQPTIEDYLLALDAFTAASRVEREAEHPPDLAGVLVLLDIAEARFRAALARHEGRPVAPRVFRCVENPLRGPVVNVAADVTDLREWRPDPSDTVGYPICAECRRSRRSNLHPDRPSAPISDVTGVRSRTIEVVAYYEITRPRTAWSATAFGNIRGATDRDLVARVLRGEHRMTPAQARDSVARARRGTRSVRPTVDLRASGDFAG